MKIDAATRKVHQMAVAARRRAYAPYSKFKVGAALEGSGGRLYSGSNVENASYGGTVCAERVAILKAVSEGVKKFKQIVVVTDAKPPAAPCALCLQTMAEFFDPGTRIHLASPMAVLSTRLFSELLPLPFGPRQLRGER